MDASLDPTMGIIQRAWELANSSSLTGALFLGVSVGVFLILRVYASKTYKLLDSHLSTQSEATRYFREQHGKYERAIGVLQQGQSSILDAIESSAIHHTQHEKDVEEVAMKLDDLLRGAEGNMSDQQIVKMVAAYSDKVHSRLQLWWHKRVEQNHVLDMRDIVEARYGDKLEEISRKFVAEVAGYRYRGRSLSEWGTDRGIREFYSEVLRMLFSVQLDMAQGREPVIKAEEMDAALDRKQSTLMQSVREWMTSGRTLESFMSENRHEERGGQLEWLRTN